MWKPLKMVALLVPMALALMGFDVKLEETELDRLPARSMFGDDARTPDVKALRTWVLGQMECRRLRWDSGQVDPVRLTCPFYRLGDRTAASAGPLRVKPLGQEPLQGYLGLRCQQSEFGDLLGNDGKPRLDHGLHYHQLCVVDGWAYELSMDLYYGLDT